MQKGERYKVALTDKCLGARWWAFASFEELYGVRLRAWREPAEEAAETEGDQESHEEMEREWSQKYGDEPATVGENPMMLAMVMESEEVEFEVVQIKKIDTAKEPNQAEPKRLLARAR